MKVEPHSSLFSFFFALLSFFTFLSFPLSFLHGQIMQYYIPDLLLLPA